MKFFLRKNFIFSLILLTSSCLKYDTDLNSLEKINVTSLAEIKRGEACSHNLFGGFSIPYVGETAIKLFGDQSVISAIKNANITSVYAIDKYSKNYFFYSKRCTIVFGK
ncbi:MAG: hypothetical protein EBT63_00990 [Proteobacteria bacterium]|nr:hypothetical protein [Pseudomonadota bacterium]NCA27863.1 hypothetical protein [Pseudomonadota bacterium]